MNILGRLAATAAKIFIVVFISLALCTLAFALVEPRWLGGIVLLGLFGYLAIFPTAHGNLFCLTSNYPLILARLALAPAVIGALTLVFPSHTGETAADAGATQAGAARLAHGEAEKAQPQAKPAPAPAPVRHADLANQVSWRHGTLFNDASLPLLRLTLACKLFYKNGKLADETRQDLVFDEKISNKPLFPGSSTTLKPAFDYAGNLDDIDESATTCTARDPGFALPNPDALPLSIVAHDTDGSRGRILTASLKNTSSKKFTISKLNVSCLVTQQRKYTVEEILRRASIGKDTPEFTELDNYYPGLVAQPFFTDKDKRIDIPPNASIDVRLHREGGMFSSD